MLEALALVACIACDAPAKTFDADIVTVDVELVLAVDVSRSMDLEEFALQRAGYVAALRHPEFIAAVLAGANRRVAITYFEWAGTVREDSVVPWQVIDGAESAAAFATLLEARPFSGFRGTSISGALTYGAGLFAGNDAEGWRRVIDISGDGPNNAGLPITAARDAAVADGIIINGLPILVRPSRTTDSLDAYYAECVIGGPGAFVLPIRQASEFATAIRRKLILEVSGTFEQPATVKVQADAPADCTVGERDRQRFSDPYFPGLDR